VRIAFSSLNGQSARLRQLVPDASAASADEQPELALACLLAQECEHRHWVARCEPLCFRHVLLHLDLPRFPVAATRPRAGISPNGTETLINLSAACTQSKIFLFHEARAIKILTLPAN